MRKYKVLILVFALLCLAFGFTACKNPQNSSGDPPVEITITLNQTELSIEEYEKALLIATVSGSDEEIVWTSSDSTVASVDNGSVSALATGTAIITASVGDEQATCNVTVRATSSVPVLSISHEETTLRVGDELNVSASLKFNNIIRDVEIEWESENTNVAVVENGKITATGVGETEVIVTATFAKQTVQKSLKVIVRDDVEILVSATSIVLKNDAAIDPDKTEIAINPTAKVNNQPYQGEFAFAVANDEIVSIQDGRIKALKAGETQVQISIVVNGKEYSQSINVLVEKSEKIVSLVEIFETYAGIDSEGQLIANTLELPLNDQLINETVTLADADTEKVVEIEVQDDAILIDGNLLGANIYGDVKIFSETEIHKLVFCVNIVTKYICTAEDFNALTTYGNIDENYDYDGLFVLKSDLDLPNHTYTEGGQQKSAPFWSVVRPIQEGKVDGTTGFKGVFDGNGYQISFRDFGWVNMGNETDGYNYGGPTETMGTGDHNGLFGNVATGAVIKNLGVNANICQMWEWVKYGVFAECFAGTLENCSVLIRSTDNYAVNTGIAQIMPNAKIVDCMLWLDLYNTRNPFTAGAGANGGYGDGPQYCTSYIAYAYDARKAPTFENTIVVINESQIYDSETQTWTKREAKPFAGYALSDLEMEGITVYEYTQNFNLDELPFKAENKKYWRTASREVLAPQADGTWGNVQFFTHLTMAGGINPLSDEVGLEWSDKWTN